MDRVGGRQRRLGPCPPNHLEGDVGSLTLSPPCPHQITLIHAHLAGGAGRVKCVTHWRARAKTNTDNWVATSKRRIYKGQGMVGRQRFTSELTDPPECDMVASCGTGGFSTCAECCRRVKPGCGCASCKSASAGDGHTGTGSDGASCGSSFPGTRANCVIGAISASEQAACTGSGRTPTRRSGVIVRSQSRGPST
jgi:hypothetical protein